MNSLSPVTGVPTVVRGQKSFGVNEFKGSDGQRVEELLKCVSLLKSKDVDFILRT